MDPTAGGPGGAPATAGRREGPPKLALRLAAFAAALAGGYLYSRAHTRRAERRHPPIGRFLEIDGVRLHYIDEGRGLPVVLLHGEGGLLQEFTLSVLPALAEHHRVVAFDRPGYGYSTRPQDRSWTPRRQAALFRAALGRIGVDRPVILGHSWGALVALAYAIDHPDDIRSAVLMDGFFYPTPRIGAILLGAAGSLPLLSPLLCHTLAPPFFAVVAPLIVRATFSPSDVPARFQAFPLDLVTRPGQIRASLEENGLLVPCTAEMRTSYAGVRVPLAIVAGEGDKILYWPAHSRRLHREVRCSVLRIVAGGGHMPHYVRPDEVIEAVRWAVAADGR